MNKTNKWGKWYLSEDGKTLVCLVGQWVSRPIPLCKVETEELRQREIERIFGRTGEWTGGALKRSGYDLVGLKRAFRDLYSQDSVTIAD